jgi:hypothetical protein
MLIWCMLISVMRIYRERNCSAPIDTINREQQLKPSTDHITVKKKLLQRLAHHLTLHRHAITAGIRRPINGSPVPERLVLPATDQSTLCSQRQNSTYAKKTLQAGLKSLNLRNFSQGQRTQSDTLF